jgi:acyl transferase domain-containing protein/thioesterase domain-containing protein/acyl carrier protein
MEIVMTLAAGATLVLAPRSALLPGLPLRRLMREQRITIASMPPSAIAALDIEGDGDPRSLPVETIIAAGEALPAGLVSRFGPGRRFFNLYGPTETTIGATIGECRPDGSKPSIGKPVQNTRCYVLDAHMQPVPMGVPGELYIGGAGVAHGYHERPEFTAARFVTNPFGEGRLYTTGDRVRWLEDGSLDFMGRFDDQVKLRGFRIELGEVEAQLGRHVAVRMAAAKLVQTAAAEPLLVAYVVPRPGAPADLASSLQQYLREHLPEPLVPSTIVPLDRLPLNPSGKIDRAALPAPALPSRTLAPATSPVEEAVSAIWREVLGAPSIGLDDRFFEVGGHSLALARVQALLRARLGVELDVVSLLGLPTIRALAGHIAAQPRAPRLPEAPAPSVERSGAIAIVGMAIRAPGVRDTRALWDALREGRELIRTLDPQALIDAGADPGRVKKPSFIAREGVLEDADRFDAAFFGFSDADAAILDPQQRLFLESAHEALEHAGCDPARFLGRIGVFGGAGMPRHWLGPVADSLREGGSDLDAYRAMTLNANDFLATRVAFKLGLRGPAITVQTGCSTSLAAVHTARQSLLADECDVALAGGVSLASLDESEQGYLHAEGGILSADGHCRPFDEAANGTVKSSGVALVVLKRLADALADGDTIHAVIAGSAMNNDGSAAKAGFTAPSEEGLAEAIERAHASAGVDPGSIGFVEAHGTGTRLGDPTEVRALTRAYRRYTDRSGFCALGSLKANLGHLDAAAGVAGLIKATLALSHEVIPPAAGFQTPNPLLGLSETPFYINNAPVPWPRAASPRRAGVSAMGIGGTNVHVVLEEAPKAAPRSSMRPSQLLCLSARTPSALAELADRLEERLAHDPSLDLADVAHTLAVGRAQRKHRIALVCRDAREAAHALGKKPRAGIVKEKSPRARPVVFLFPGHGAQYGRMGLELHRAEPGYRAEVDRCLDILREDAGLDLGPLLLGDAPEDDPRLDEMRWAQPLLFTVEYALGKLLLSWGVRPTAMLGHSLGEYVTACLAGVFSLRDALAFVATRGRLMDETPPGGMLTVFGDERAVARHLGKSIAIATYAPGCVVLSGPASDIEALRARLDTEGLETRAVRVSRASHSPLMDAIRDQLRRRVARASLGSPAIPVISNVTGTVLTAAEAQSPDYWAEHLTRPVRLTEGLGALLDLESPIFLELGPGTTMGSFLKGHPRHTGDASAVVATMPGYKRRDESAHGALLGGLGAAWELGMSIDWNAFYGHEQRKRIPLPAHPFERRQYSLRRKPSPSPADLDARSLEHARELGVRGIDGYPGVRARLEQLCALLVLDFFVRRLGSRARDAHTAEALRQSAGILPKFEPMAAYLSQLLLNANLARKTPDGQLLLQVDNAGRSADVAAQLRNDCPELSGVVRFLAHCVGHYDEALTGPAEPVGVLYPDGTDALYRTFMRDTKPYLHDAIYLATARDAVVEIVERRKGQKMRILEVGGGHGTLTWPLVERLRGTDVEYHFTDIGRSFLLRAENEAERRGLPFLKCSRFDLNGSPEAQGLVGPYDIIVGYNAVHVAIDLDAALAGLQGLMAPEGAMLLVEFTRTETWDFLTWGLAPGFWDIQRARGGALGMELHRWEETLSRAGFASVRGVPRNRARRSAEEHGLVLAERARATRPLERAPVPVKAIAEQPASRKVGAPSDAPAAKAPDEADRLVRRLWERLLGLSPLPAEAHFFDLGGDSLLAVQFLADLRTRTGCQIKTSRFAENPTLDAVAALVRAASAPAPEPAPLSPAPSPAPAKKPESADPCLVPLRSSGSKRPFFCVHPIGGGALCYAPLARAMNPERPFYGLQSPMLEDRAARPSSIEEMASLYIDAIRRVQPRGPYLLGGWSFGGVVAAEMARRLRARGEAVAQLVLLDVDASPPGRLALLRQIDERLPTLSMLPAIFHEVRGAAGKAPGRPGIEPLADTLAVAAKNLVVYDHHLAIWRSHTPAELDVPATHFVASERSRLGSLLRAQATPQMPVRGAKVVRVPGDHFSMLSGNHAELLAPQLEAALQTADMQPTAEEDADARSLAQAEASVRAWVDRFVGLTFVGGKIVIDEMFTPTDTDVLIDVCEPIHVGADAAAEHLERQFQAFRDLRKQMHDARVKVFAGGRSAYATAFFNSELTLVKSGRRISLRHVRVTWVLERTGDTWRAVHIHSSLPVGEPLYDMEG